MGTARSHSRSHGWLRVLVLLLALLAPSAPSELSAPPVAAAEIGEYDVLGAALRPAPRAHRPAAPLGSTPRPAPAPAAATVRPLPASPATSPYTVRCLRTVVLRC
ncbi:hypothetical protein GCM10010269_13520 [Streptomyces humidus]|uniref:Uncharacterized protein n=1 Tax=Streptomyces humidus TaxID=52259 RepID=A0A918FS67_9ACTN|nr:hypothetical protein [Streptomyces humidus]GGR75587.1 hypothetical protein GCM10010269_13520 [Streptomyces humidus]